jgi:hypothetical protein
MQLGQLTFQQNVIVISAGNIAGTSGAGAAAVERLMHRREHCGMLTHSEIVVRTPNGHFTGTARMMVIGPWKGTGLTLKICKYAIPPFAMQAVKLLAEIGFIVHEEFPKVLSEAGAIGTG